MLYFIHTVYFWYLHLIKHYHLLRLRITSLYTKSLLSIIIYRFEDSYWFSYPKLKYFYYSIFKKREKVSVDFVSGKSSLRHPFMYRYCVPGVDLHIQKYSEMTKHYDDIFIDILYPSCFLSLGSCFWVFLVLFILVPNINQLQWHMVNKYFLKE